MTVQEANSGISKEWTEISHELIKDPDNFSKWCQLIKISESINGGIYKKSSDVDKKLLRVSYEQLLHKFPFLEQYRINFATWEFKLGDTNKADDVYKKSLIILPYSITLWISYLRFKVETLLDTEAVIQIFERARLAIGTHYFGHEFYDLYLEFLLNNYQIKKYYILLRRIIEIPLYHYSKYFNMYIKLIENLNEETKPFLLNASELSKFPNNSNSEIKTKLKKTFTDLYITTQYHSYELYHFESTIKRHYFSVDYLPQNELSNWDLYLTYMELKGTPEQVKLLYERCIISTAMYPKFWIKYANYYISQGKIESAKQLLYNGIYSVNSQNHELKLKLVDLELYRGNYIKAREIVLDNLRYLPDSAPFFIEFLKLEKMNHQIEEDNNDEYIINLIKFKLDSKKKDGKYDFLFNEILRIDLRPKTLRNFFEHYRNVETSWSFWKAYIQFCLNTNDLDMLSEVYLLAKEKLSKKDVGKLSYYWDTYLLQSNDLAEFYNSNLQS